MKNEFIKDIEVNEVKNIMVSYSDHLEDNAFVAITEWKNGEGFDVDLNAKEHFGITWTEFDCLKKAVKVLTK